MTTYEEYVSRGREILQSIRCYQAEIAWMATQICVQVHGGRLINGEYTITRYADDLGLNRKTLSGWVEIYRNVIQKLDMDLKDVTKENWQIATRVNALLKAEKQANQALMGLSGKKDKGWRIKTPPSRIRQLFNKCSQGRTPDADIAAFTDYVIFIKGRLGRMDVTDVDITALTYLKQNLDQASSLVTDHIYKKGTV